jgi:hypothetical protein
MKLIPILLFVALPLVSYKSPQIPFRERVILSFKLIHSNKMVNISMDRDGRYLVYRFGRPDSVELQYPDQLDSTSWKTFTYYDYHRGGGKQNLGMDLDTVRFTRNDVMYAVYQSYYAEDGTYALGIEVTNHGKVIHLKGDRNTQVGSLLDEGLKTHLSNGMDN